jgi:hypothetical protein
MLRPCEGYAPGECDVLGPRKAAARVRPPIFSCGIPLRIVGWIAGDPAVGRDQYPHAPAQCVHRRRPREAAAPARGRKGKPARPRYPGRHDFGNPASPGTTGHRLRLHARRCRAIIGRRDAIGDLSDPSGSCQWHAGARRRNGRFPCRVADASRLTGKNETRSGAVFAAFPRYGQ